MASTDASSTTEKRFAHIVSALRRKPGVSAPDATARKRKGFGSSALKVNDKIFAMLTSAGEFVVKLPRDRVDAFIASGDGTRFDPGHGRVMKEWLVLSPTSKSDWLAIATEALGFVGGK